MTTKDKDSPATLLLAASRQVRENMTQKSADQRKELQGGNTMLTFRYSIIPHKFPWRPQSYPSMMIEQDATIDQNTAWNVSDFERRTTRTYGFVDLEGLPSRHFMLKVFSSVGIFN
jgi:hypothetical protein